MTKLTAIMLIVIGSMISISTQAKIWRVNNFGTAVADFTTAQAAHDGASAGDTIYFEGSPTSYGNLLCSKKLILIGTGYFLSNNPETQPKNLSSTLGKVFFNPGSANSCIMGCVINSSYDLTITSSNIKLTRNHILLANGTRILVNGSFSNILISDNYLFTTIELNTSFTISNVMISNNIFAQTWTGFPYITSGNLSGCLILNNVFAGGNIGITVYNSQIYNNIMTSGTFTTNNNTYTNNIGSGTQFGNSNGNQQNVAAADIFMCTASCTGYSPDGQWQLKALSPAIGAGVGGIDCGAFGGNTPYVLSGMPNIPAIYYFTNFSSGNQLNVNLKVKSHN
jgi:hypothetical protein